MPYSDPEKQREYQREYCAKNRAKWISANGPCVDCGSSERLEVDHVDRTTKVSHKVWSWSEARRHEELAKCVVRCYDCHKEKTRLEEHGERSHGTRRMYNRGECRCALCTAANAAYQRDRYTPETRREKYSREINRPEAQLESAVDS